MTVSTFMRIHHGVASTAYDKGHFLLELTTELAQMGFNPQQLELTNAKAALKLYGVRAKVCSFWFCQGIEMNMSLMDTPSL